MHGQDRPDRHSLLLASGEGPQISRTQRRDAEEVEGLLDPSAHGVGGQPELLHAVGELLLDGVGDEPRRRVLPDVPDHVRPLPWRLVDHRPAVDADVAGQRAAREPRNQTGHDAQQRRLADAGAAGHEHHLPFVDGQVDVAEDGCVVVAEPEVAQLDHATPPSSGAVAAGCGEHSAPATATITITRASRLSVGATRSDG